MRNRLAQFAWLLVLMAAMLGCRAAQLGLPYPPSRPSEPTQPRSDQSKTPVPIVRLRLVVFSATWCNPCLRAKPTVAEIEASGVEVVRVDIDAGSALVAKYRIASVPTFILYRDDQQVMRTHDVEEILAAIAVERNGQ